MPSPTPTTPSYRHELSRRPGGRWRVDAVKQVSYEVLVRRDLLAVEDPYLARALRDCVTGSGTPSDRRLLIVDRTVETLYGQAIDAYFAAHGFAAAKLVLDAHEQVKDWNSVEAVLAAMDDFGVDRRREPVIAIGGGVLCDVVGFAASIYRRGTPYVRIPTTLIGLIDAGVGVKTGVNHRSGKNRIGTYAQPLLSLLDTSFLGTLPARHLSNGLAEILKVALVKSDALFTSLERAARCGTRSLFDDPFHADLAEYITYESIHLMLEELQPNLWEAVLERCVDYGHTFSPTVEMHSVAELLHGEAVAVDMALTTGLSVGRGLMSEEEGVRVLRAMRGLGLNPWNDALGNHDLLCRALEDTVRHRDGLQRLPLTRGIGGHVFVNDVTPAEIAAGVAFVAAHAPAADELQEAAV
ncbi:sedoheptulose 7-phosphate cyclase [Streptomyces paromomycinus]|uniref:2-epi-5-epi-valiolone synthase n=1 Tax=Streptomyces paromomycinus TaxID=92743 RepID=A0A401W9I4_STREY|nr:sedoheptulose 7-phosphate cyclase [Streptomyces paromomycinus]GCD45987.1 3-dehydroquinate synthase [Streptomyces paromomycinus]